MSAFLTTEQLLLLTGIAVGMYLIATVVLGLQLTVDILRMRQPNLLTRVTGAAMLIDATNIIFPAIMASLEDTIDERYWRIMMLVFDYTTLLMLLSIGDVLLNNKFSKRKVTIAISVIIPTIISYFVWGRTAMHIVVVPVFFLALYAIIVNCRRILKYENNLPYIYSNTEHRHKQWYVWLCVFILIEILFWLWVYIAKENSILPKLLYYVFMTFFWIYVFRFASMQRPVTIDVESIDVEGTADIDLNNEEQNSETSANEGEEGEDGKERTKSNLLIRMETLMAEKKLYLNSDLTLIVLAEELGTNRTYVSQIFNHELNVTFYQYVNKLRVEYACKRITESDEKLSSIAYESGFSSPANMVRVMREYIGMTPSQIRANGGGKIRGADTNDGQVS